MSVIFYIKDTGFLGFVFGSILLVYFISRPVEQLLKWRGLVYSQDFYQKSKNWLFFNQVNNYASFLEKKICFKTITDKVVT